MRTSPFFRAAALAASLSACAACSGDGSASIAPVSTAAFLLKSGDGSLLRGDSLKLTARTSLSGDSVATRVVIQNVSERRIRLQWGACSMSLQLYKNDRRVELPAFDWLRRPNPDPAEGVTRACPAYLAIIDLAPRDTVSPVEFRLTLPVARIAGDSLPLALYYAADAVQLAGSTERLVVPSGSLERIH